MIRQRFPKMPRAMWAVIALACWYFAGCGAMPVSEVTSSTQQQLVTCPSGQTLATFQRGSVNPGPVADTGINSAAPTVNSGTNTAINVGSTGSRAVLIRFDVSILPAGSTVQSATMGLVNNLAPSSGTVTIATNNATWIESGTGSVTWATAPTYSAAIASQGNSGAAGSAFAVLIPSSTVQGWVTSSSANYGLRLDESSGTTNVFASEYTTTANRPRLDVCYTPVAPTCTDGIKNGAETSIDCGGGSCPACINGQACLVNADCVSATCTGSVCVAPPSGCSDGVKNGLETDIDCGGGVCAACVIGKSCLTGNDCGTSACGSIASTCIAAPTCSAITTVAITTVNVTYGPSGELASVFTPTGTPPVGGWPYMVGIPGGGFTALPGGGRLASALTYWAQVLNAQGIGLITADYVLTAAGSPHSVNPFPAAVNDMRYLDCWIQANAATYNIDVTRVGWVGFSAGGNLVGIFSTSLGTNVLPSGTVLTTPTCTLTGTVKFWGEYYGNVGMVPSEWSASNPNEWYYLDSYPVGGTLPVSIQSDATVVVHAGDPPVLITDGSSDTTVYPAALRRLSAQSRAVGVATLDVVIPTGVHGYGPFQWGPAIYQPSTCALNAWVLWLLSSAPLPPL